MSESENKLPNTDTQKLVDEARYAMACDFTNNDFEVNDEIVKKYRDSVVTRLCDALERTQQSEDSPPPCDVNLVDKSIVLNLAEDIMHVAKLGPNPSLPGHESIQRDLLAAADVMLRTIDAAYELKRRLEQSQQALRPVPAAVRVNGAALHLYGAVVSYENVVELAGKPGATHLTVAYERSSGAGGTLIPGESVPLSDGMVFCVTSTSNA